MGERSISLRKLIHVTPAIFRRTEGAHVDRLIRMARLLFWSMTLAGTQLLDGLHFACVCSQKVRPFGWG